jgi:hypothetical protein
MTGPEHYREAERIEAACKSRSRADDEGFTNWERGDLAALAQVHATLALVAATVDAAAHPPGQSQVDYLGAWWEAGA